MDPRGLRSESRVPSSKNPYRKDITAQVFPTAGTSLRIQRCPCIKKPRNFQEIPASPPPFGFIPCPGVGQSRALPPLAARTTAKANFRSVGDIIVSRPSPTVMGFSGVTRVSMSLSDHGKSITERGWMICSSARKDRPTKPT